MQMQLVAVFFLKYYKIMQNSYILFY